MTKHVLKESLAVKRKIEPIFTRLRVLIDKNGEFLFCCCENKIKVVSIANGEVYKLIPPKDDNIEDVANFTANENDVFIAHKNGFVKQWSFRSDDPSIKRTWNTSHIGAIAFMTFDSSGSILATGGCDSLVKLWDTERQYITHYLKGCTGVISFIKFHPKPKQDEPYYLLATGDHDSIVNLYDLKTSKLIHKFEGHSSTVTAIEILTDCEKDRVITCGRDKLLMIWCLESFSSLRKFPVFESLESLFLIPKGKCFRNEIINENLVVTGGERGILKVWNFETGKLVYEQENSILRPSDTENGHESQLITQIIYKPTNDEIAVISFENNVLFYKLNGFNLVRQLVGHNDEVLDIKFLCEDNFMVVATNSRHIKIFDLKTLNCSIVEGHTDIVLSISVFACNSLMFSSSSKDNTVRIWLFDENTMTATCFFRGSGHSHSVTSLVTPFTSLNWIITGSEDTTIKFWSVPDLATANGQVLPLSSKFATRAHDKNINSLAVSPNDKYLCSGSQDKTAKLWSIGDDLTLIGTLRGHRRGIWCVTFSPVDQVVATSSVDGTIKIWSISDLSCLKTFEGHDCSVLKVQFISRGTQLISTSSDGNLKLWRVKTNECTKTIDAHEDKIWSLAVSKDEQIFITGSADSKIIFWKDVTIEEQEEAATKLEEFIEEEQKLLNFIERKKWTKAVKVAIRLQQPFRALNVLKEIICEEEYNEDQQLKSDIVKLSLGSLREDELLSLLKYAMKWNTNSKHCEVAQRVLRVAFEVLGHEKLLSTSDAKEVVESFLPFSERHFNRLSQLHQSVTFMQFMWNNIKLSDNTNSSDNKSDE